MTLEKDIASQRIVVEVSQPTKVALHDMLERVMRKNPQQKPLFNTIVELCGIRQDKEVFDDPRGFEDATKAGAQLAPILGSLAAYMGAMADGKGQPYIRKYPHSNLPLRTAVQNAIRETRLTTADLQKMVQDIESKSIAAGIKLDIPAARTL